MLSQTPVLFFFNDTATTEIYTLSLHDALPIYGREACGDQLGRGVRGQGLDHRLGETAAVEEALRAVAGRGDDPYRRDRKSTRLNSSHANISYAVFCLKKKNICNSQLSSSARFR